MPQVRLSKNQLRRQRAKKQKLAPESTEAPEPSKEPSSPKKPDISIQTQTKPRDALEDIEVPESLAEQYSAVFEKFEPKEEVPEASSEPVDDTPETSIQKIDVADESSEQDSDFEYELEQDPEQPTVPKKRVKVPISQLKAHAKYPNLVEWSDSNAQDPYLLISIKENSNVIPVPSHWSAKRDYLSGKRGIERPPFQLPGYILDTGIQDMRNSLDDSTIRQQQRERIQPKLGKLDIDYQKLHDAFFKYQTKPKVLGYGDVYYEGRENTDESHDKLEHIKPGKLSVELLKALGFPEDGNTAPSWISTMAQMGKPPSYSNLIIPGIDVKYANVGYLANEDEYYGQNLETVHWGEVDDDDDDDDDDEDEDEDEDDDGDEDEEDEEEDYNTINAKEGEIIPLGESDDDKHIEDEVVLTSKKRSLYTILKDGEDARGNGLLGPGKTYEVKESEKESVKHEQKDSKEQDHRKFKF